MKDKFINALILLMLAMVPVIVAAALLIERGPRESVDERIFQLLLLGPM